MKKYIRNILLSKKDELSHFIKKYGIELGIIKHEEYFLKLSNSKGLLYYNKIKISKRILHWSYQKRLS